MRSKVRREIEKLYSNDIDYHSSTHIHNVIYYSIN